VRSGAAVDEVIAYSDGISGSGDESAIDTFLSASSFWVPDRIDVTSAWIEHAPFAFWLVDVARPRRLVELGTHCGYSYLAFCQAVHRCGLAASCFAIDTWKGDEHSGFYGEEVYDRLSAYHDRYRGFSQLLRSTFADALQYFEDRSIDILHIDGRHFYDDVKTDFETWQPKLSDRAVVIFHDINVRERNFGVWRLWGELRMSHPGFEFVHGHGLGVLGIGTELPTRVKALLSIAEPLTADAVRASYARLGAAITDRLLRSEITTRERQLQERVAEREAEVRQRDTELAALREAAQQHAADLRTRRDAIATLQNEVTTVRAALAQAEDQISKGARASASMEAEINELKRNVASLQLEVEERTADAASLRDELAVARQVGRSLLAALRTGPVLVPAADQLTGNRANFPPDQA
jgi:archaellum component FlaC